MNNIIEAAETRSAARRAGKRAADLCRWKGGNPPPRSIGNPHMMTPKRRGEVSSNDMDMSFRADNDLMEAFLAEQLEQPDGARRRRALAKRLTEALNSMVDGKFDRPDLLRRIPNLPSGNVIALAAMHEIVQRQTVCDGIRITDERGIFLMLQPFASDVQERLICVTISPMNTVIGTHVVFVGSLGKASAEPREIFHRAISDRAHSIIIAHNHPSGNVVPSPADIHATKQLAGVGEMLGIPVRDHIVFSRIDCFPMSLHPDAREMSLDPDWWRRL